MGRAAFFKKCLKEFKKWHRQEGFLLVEMALVMALTGLMMSIALVSWSSRVKVHKNQVTRQHQEQIVGALYHYFLRFGCLPEPYALPLPSYGKGEDKLYQNLIGVLPFQVLGLSEETARDGFGYWISYAVDPHLTIKGTLSFDDLCDKVFTEPSPIDVIQGDWGSLKANLEKEGGRPRKFMTQNQEEDFMISGKQKSHSGHDGVAFVLIAHGGGWGSWSKKGQRPLDKKGGKAHRANASGGRVFYSTPVSGDNGRFEDILLWRTRSQLMQGCQLICKDKFWPKDQWQLPHHEEGVHQKKSSHGAQEGPGQFGQEIPLPNKESSKEAFVEKPPTKGYPTFHLRPGMTITYPSSKK